MHTSTWIVRPRLDPQPRLRLFCFPYAGGGASIFRSWAELLPPTVEVCAIQAPGRENRLGEPAFAALDTLVDQLIPELLPLIDRPFALFGHSLGALVAFEVARQLCSRHCAPHYLFVAGRAAPQLARSGPQTHTLPRPAFVEHLRQLNGTPEAVLQNEALLQLMLPLLRADFAMHETYQHSPGAPLDVPISAFGGLEDLRVGREQLMAWQSQTSARWRWRMLPGDHFFLNTSRWLLVRSIIEDLQTVSDYSVM